MAWQTVIGLEVHAQLKTRSKLFSGASTAYGADANTQACEIDLGLPGVLPVLNAEAVNMAIKFGLAIDATINRNSVFARKNYFYPDLPKGYQISQFDQAIVENGRLTLHLENTPSREITIVRAHLEEDAGKSLHDAVSGYTGIDLNRAGNPLIEIVSAPMLYSAQEAVAYLKTLHALVRYLTICDGNMQEGSFRCDANVSVRPVGSETLGTRVEIKNLNSFRFIEKAIDYEVARQIDLIEEGGTVVQETRLYDPEKNQTRTMRLKEHADDYRYFPDPDLAPVFLKQSQIDAISKDLPELPEEKQKRFHQFYQLSDYDAHLLIREREIADFFESVINAEPDRAPSIDPKLVANWLLGALSAALNRTDLSITDSPIGPKQLSRLIHRIMDNTLSSPMAKTVFEHMWSGNQGGDPDKIIEHYQLKQLSDSTALIELIQAVIKEFPEQVTHCQAGEEKLLGFLIGQVMKRSQGKADPKLVNQLFKEQLGLG